MQGKFRTDLAVEQICQEKPTIEGVNVENSNLHGFPVKTVSITTSKAAEMLCKPIGKYITIHLEKLIHRHENAFNDAIHALAEVISTLLEGDSYLVAGLGNLAVTPDAVGVLALDNILVTRHLKEVLPLEFCDFAEVSAIKTGVLGTTGIESAETLSSIISATQPSQLIAVDALATSSPEHLCKTMQISNTGISPGAGVGNNRKELSKANLGIPVLAIGVPTIIDAATFSDNVEEMFVTPRSIDSCVHDSAKLIGYALNLALHKGLTISDVDMLL